MYAATERLVGMSRFEDPEFLNKLRLAQQYGGATPGVVVGTFLSAISTLITIVGFGGSLIALSIWLPIGLILTILPVLAIEMWIAMQRSRMQWGMSSVERREMFYRDLLSNTQAAKEIRLFGLGSWFRHRMTAERALANRGEAAVDRKELAAQLASGLLAGGFVAVALLWAAGAAARGRLTVGDIALLIAAITAIQTASSALMRELGRSKQQLMLFQAYLDVRDCPPDMIVPDAPTAVPPLTKGVELRDVWFRYSEHSPWVLQGVNLHITKGTSLGIVGRNGAGKSTLVKLLLRMYDPTAGTIFWDGVDIRNFEPAEYRQKLSAVFQDYMEYDLSARENIGVGDLALEFDPVAVRGAALTAEADGFIQELPRGYETMLSRIFFEGEEFATDDGVSLSGGQWQRLAIARSLLRSGRDVMILDEPSSGLDAEAEHQIHRTFTRLRRDRTSILVSHRLGSLRDADHIVVLEGGVIAEQGSHDDLIAANSRYSEMFSAQASGYQLAAVMDTPEGAGQA
jgi:ATP-binding cassette subfamily B protein